MLSAFLILGMPVTAYPQQSKGKTTQTQKKGVKKSTVASSKKSKSNTSDSKSGTTKKSNTKSQTSKNSANVKKGGSGKKTGNVKGASTTKNKVETSADIKKRHESTNREIQLTKQQIAENEKSVKLGLNELSKLETSIGESTRQVEATQREVTELDGKIARLEADIAENERSLNFMRDQYKKAIKKVRGSQRGNSTLSFIFSSDNFHQALRRMRYLKKFSDWKDKRSKEISAKVESLRQQTALLDGTRADMRSALARSQTAKQNLENQYKRQDALVADLKRNGDALRSHLQKKQAEANQLKNRISELIAAEQRAAEAKRQEEARKAEEAKKREQERLLAEQKAQKEREQASGKEDVAAVATPVKPAKDVASADKKSDKKTSAKDTKKGDNKSTKEKKNSKKQDKKSATDQSYADARKRRPRSNAQSGSVPKDTKVESKEEAKPHNGSKPASAAGGSFEKMRGSLPRPVAGSFNITSKFGRHSLPDLPEVMYDNPGIDAEVAAGATASAVFGGKVSGVYRIPGYSTVVIVNHGNYYTVYGNISSPAVKVGDQVAQGTALGHLAPDEDDPSHSTIHFEVWKNRDKLNPTDWIR